MFEWDKIFERDKIFAERRAGLLKWALEQNKLDWEVALPERPEVAAKGKITPRSDGKIKFEMTIPLPGNWPLESNKYRRGETNNTVIFNGETGRIESFSIVEHEETGLRESVFGAEIPKPKSRIIESGEKSVRNKKIPPEINERLGMFFEKMGREMSGSTMQRDRVKGKPAEHGNSR